MSNSRGRGPISKAKAKARYSRILLIAGITLAGFLFVGATDVQGQDNTDTQTQEQIQQDIELRKKYRNQVILYKKKANYWHHKRTGKIFVAATRPTPWYKTTEGARKASVFWRKQARKQFLLYKRYVARWKKKVNACVHAGWPRRLCPAVINGTAAAGVPSWYKDPALAWIVFHESGFRPCVRNGGTLDCHYTGSSSYGLFQFLGSTWSGVGCRITSNPTVQVKCGARYIKRRYHTPASAKRWWLAHHWY